MSQADDQQIQALLAQLMGVQRDPIEFVRVEFAASGPAFVAYNADGEGWGGDLTSDKPVEEIKANLLKDLASGGLGYHFADYYPVPEDELAERRAAHDDWVDIYNA